VANYKNYDAYLNETVFKPAGMKSSEAYNLKNPVYIKKCLLISS
jgi:CubicO group peptidase (beta-lactamase class C family)